MQVASESCNGLKLALDVARLEFAEGDHRIYRIDNVIVCFRLPDQMQLRERVS